MSQDAKALQFYRAQAPADIRKGDWFAINTYTGEVLLERNPSAPAVSGIDFNDPINHPKHYNQGNIEVIEFIEDQGLGHGFAKGNALKYLARAGAKDPTKEIEDLEKAAWYIRRLVEIAKAKKEGRSAVRPNQMVRA